MGTVAFPACSDRCPGLTTGSPAAAQPPALPLLNPCGFCGSHPCSGNMGLPAEHIVQAASRALPVSLPEGFYTPCPPSHPTREGKPASHTHLQHLTEAGGSSVRGLELKCPCAGGEEGRGSGPLCTQAPRASVSATPKAPVAETSGCALPRGRYPTWV